MDLTQVLLATQNPDVHIRQQAEEELKRGETQNLGAYFSALVAELSSSEKPIIARQLSGLLLKNALYSKDRTRDQQAKQRWMSLDDSIKTTIKDTTLSVLKDPIVLARNTACQVVAKIGSVELPVGKWPQLVPILLNAVTELDSASKQSALTVIGFLCEELASLSQETEDEVIPQEQSNQILTAVVQGMRNEEIAIKEAATKALYHALVLAQRNFQNESERSFIIEVVCENCKSTSPNVQISSFECIVQIATEYYDYLGPYMNTIGPLTWETIKNAPENVAIPAMEFWSTLSDEEFFLDAEAKEAQEAGRTPERTSQNFIRQALQYLLPILLEPLTRQSEDDEDTWTIAMAAGTCLSLVAQVVGDEVVGPVLTYVNQHFMNQDWKFREAAILAYGSIMEGPTSEKLAPIVAQSFNHLVGTLNDESVAVRDTAAWTIGRIAQFHSSIFTPLLGNHQAGLMQLLIEKLKDKPRVAAHICWVVHVLAEQNDYDKDDLSSETTPLSESFPKLTDVLLEVAQRPDAEEKNLREAAYNAVSMVISKCGKDCIPHMEKVTLQLLDRLELSFQFADKRVVAELQGLLCGCLQVLTVRLKEKVGAVAERLFACYLRVFQNYQAIPGQQTSLHEEALLAVSALANALGEGFEAFMPHFAPLLLVGLSNFEEVAVCKIANEVVGDLCRALGRSMAQYSGPILTHLYNNLQNPQVDRKLKAGIMVCIGDLAMAITGDFDQYLAPVLNVLQEAAATRLQHGPQDNDEWLEYIHQLRDGVLQAYTGVIHGLKDAGKLPLFKTHVNAVLDLVNRITEDPINDEVLKSAIAVTGDLVMAYKDELTAHLVKAPFLEKLVSTGMQSDDPAIFKHAQWLQTLLQQYTSAGGVAAEKPQ